MHKKLEDILLPDDRRYTDEHIWIKKDGSSFLSGISDFAQDQLGEVVYIDLPSVGDTFDAGVPYGEVESVGDAPATLNESPYEKGWIVRFEVANEADIEGLLTADAYRAFLNK